MKKTFSSKLPEVFQTTPNKKFFGATVDQLFSKKKSEKLNGYIGRRVGGVHDPIKDFYLPEKDKERTWRQLEPTVYSVDEDTLEKTNVVFYNDLLNFIKSYNGNVDNHDRLFSEKFYSFSPPIDIDKFLNFQNYYWVPGGLPVLSISGLTDVQIQTLILDQISFDTTSVPGVTPSALVFSSGMKVTFPGTSYTDTYYVEGVGDAIRLVEDQPDILSTTGFIYLPWNESVTIYGTEYDNSVWDALPWNTIKAQMDVDYITMERGSIDNNQWSRSNKWIHIDTINYVLSISGSVFPSNITRATRNIIEFKKDIQLFRYGTTFLIDVDHYIDAEFTDINSQTVDSITSAFGVALSENDLVILQGDSNIYSVSISSNIVTLNDVTATYNPSVDDVVGVTTTGVYVYLTDDGWVPCFNQKVKNNQPLLFACYDNNIVELDDDTKYPGSDFSGNEIFSYKINEEIASISDPVLGFPIVYKGTQTAADIVFENDIYNERYRYVMGDSILPIDGYYYFRLLSPTDTSDRSTWNLRTSWELSPIETKQRVVDRYVVGYDAQVDFRLSVTPQGFVDGVDQGDVLIFIDGEELIVTATDFVDDGTHIYFNRSGLSDGSVVEIKTYSEQSLPDDAHGYYEIPMSLENNPNNKEVSENSSGELTPHFLSILKNQPGFSGVALGGPNNYRDTLQDTSLGNVILQHLGNITKPMLVSSSKELNIIDAIRFSQNEYTKFKIKFLNTVNQLVNSGFSSAPTGIVVDRWIEQVLKTINVSRESSRCFSYSYMIGNSDVFKEATVTIDGSLQNTLSIQADLRDVKNVLYVYKKTSSSDFEQKVYNNVFNTNTSIDIILTEGEDYEVAPQFDSSDMVTITFLPGAVSVGDVVICRIYEDCAPAYIPSTPAKLGCALSHTPRLEYDTSYIQPTWVIIGHDGSKNHVFGEYDVNGDPITPDIRDVMLLELERRIYNANINRKYNTSDLLSWYDVKPGFFRSTDYTLEEIHDITKSSFYKWATKNKLDYRQNEFFDALDWRTWNYSDVFMGESGPGNWKGIFYYLYDTISPDVTPWEMLGFSKKPEWWETEYGNDYSSNNTAMWADIEAGYIRGEDRTDIRFIRSGMVTPVDSSGNLIDLPTILGTPTSFEGADKPWKYGDVSPVEMTWMNSSAYKFAIMEFLYLTKPARFGEEFFSTGGSEFLYGGQVVSKGTLTRNTTANSYVHSEIRNGSVYVGSGYDVYISDMLLFSGKSVTKEFGSKLRNLDVSLAYRLAGFTNKETLRLFLDGTNPESVSDSLQIPANNFDVITHTGKQVFSSSYSGVIIKVLSGGKFMVFGYDIENMEFKYLERSNTSNVVTLSEAGKYANFTYYKQGSSYSVGDIVKYNDVFYQCVVSHNSSMTIGDDNWTKLPKLPQVGGISVKYRPKSNGEVGSLPYGHEFNSVEQVVEFLISYGQYLESVGWVFDNVNSITGKVSTFEQAARDFLFWVSSSLDVDSTLLLSPNAARNTIKVPVGYPDAVERVSNGIYSILDKDGHAINPSDTTIDRNDRDLSIVPNSNLGVFFSKVTCSETEHVLLLANTTDFNDVIYDPLLNTRQSRILFNGVRTGDWIGKLEAPGYIIDGDKLIQNYENIVDSMQYYYDSEKQLDNSYAEEAAKHLIGYESKDYLTNLGIVDDTQYQFYKGFIRVKGTERALTKLLGPDRYGSEGSTKIYEEWAFKNGQFGGTDTKIRLDFKIPNGSVTSSVVCANINHASSNSGFISRIDIVHSGDAYTIPPEVIISPPTNGQQATAVAILDNNGYISEVKMVNGGQGYVSTPTITIIRNDVGPSTDILYAVYSPEVTKDVKVDGIINIDIDDKDLWLHSPIHGGIEFPLHDNFIPVLPNAGYVNLNDVNHLAFDESNITDVLSNQPMSEGEYIWVAKENGESFNVFKYTGIPHAYNIVDIGGFASLSVTGGFYSEQKIYAKVDGNFICDILVGNSKLTCLLKPHESTINTYDILSMDNEQISFDDLSSASNILMGCSMRTRDFSSQLLVDRPWIANGDKLWIDNTQNGWAVGIVNGSSFDYFRYESSLIDTSVFYNSFIYDTDTNRTEATLTIYDPFKDILLGQVDKNIDFKTYTDPARYTNSSDTTLIDEDRLFDGEQVGRVWWDLSSCAFLNYEQPASISETIEDVLLYRKINWGKLFPGSQIDIYQWVRSEVPPEEYSGSGEPKSINDYTVKVELNPDTNIETPIYYFWVKNGTDVFREVGKTMSCAAISVAIINPSAYGFQWFSPIYFDDQNMSLVFHGVEKILADGGSAIQLNYVVDGDVEQPHTQWILLREGDRHCEIPAYLSNKLIDSLSGVTDTITSNHSDKVSIPGYGDALLVPDRELSSFMNVGVSFRPRQTMFTSLSDARRTYVYSINRLLSQIPLREIDDSWNQNLPSNNLWEYIDWIKDGFDPSMFAVTRQVGDLSDLPTLVDVKNGEVIKVMSFTPSPTDRAQYYQYDDSNDTFVLVRIEKSAIRILDRFFTNQNNIYDAIEFRSLHRTLVEDVFVGDYTVFKNNIFFSMVNYVVTEQTDIDWLFKSSYVYILQGGQTITDDSVYVPNLFGNVYEYISEAKPYKTKVRDIVTTFSTSVDDLNITIHDDAIGELNETTLVWDTVDENLRFTKIYVKIDRVEGDINTTVLTGADFDNSGWGGYWDAFTWDTDGEYQVVVDGSGDDEDVMYSGNDFWNEYPEELAATTISDNIVMSVNIESGGPSVSYKIHITPMGTQSYLRTGDDHSTLLTTDVNRDSTEIFVSDISKLDLPHDGGPGVIWIGTERIEFFENTGNKLFNLRRGTMGTSIGVEYLTGTVVNDGSKSNEIPNAVSEYWVNNAGGIFSSTTEQALFLLDDDNA